MRKILMILFFIKNSLTKFNIAVSPDITNKQKNNL